MSSSKTIIKTGIISSGSMEISGSLSVNALVSSTEATLLLGPPPAGGAGEGGQVTFQAAGGTYTSASMIDVYQNKLRILRGTNASSDAEVANWDMHTKQYIMPAYNSATAFTGTPIASLSIASGGSVITTPPTYNLFLTNGDQSTTSNVASNITDLVTPTLVANKRYRIQGAMHIGCSSTGGVKLQITGPSGTTMYVGTGALAGSTTSIQWAPLVTNATLGAAVNTANYAFGCVLISGEVALSSTAGTLQFGFASGTNTQTSTIYQLGTQITVTQIN